jgi:anti-sigma factor ChrR (cupin superfamily)
MICFRGEQSWRLPSYKVKQFYFPAEDPGSALIRVYDAAGNVIETHEHKGEFKEW